jgi:hypothetical protein
MKVGSRILYPGMTGTEKTDRGDYIEYFGLFG